MEGILEMTFACFVSKGIGADVLDLTGQSADTFGKLSEENTWFELTPNQQQYLEMVQNVNDYLKNEYHSLHTFLWKAGYSGMGNAMPRRFVVANDRKSVGFHEVGRSQSL